MNATVKNSSRIIQDAQDRLSKALEDSKAVAQISDLANVIIQITKQTNLLALNAAIEASRAGEAGKGFAVVSEEIRRLADNSQNAVNQIQQMIQSVTGSVDSLIHNSGDLVHFFTLNVKNDYDLMLKASDDYNEDAQYLASMISDFHNEADSLNSTIQEMTRAMNEIASATNESAEGTGTIAGSIDLVTQKAAELLAQANKSDEYANSLLQLVSMFRT